MAITSAGLGSGLEINSLISQIMAVERKPLQLLQQKKVDLNAQLSAYGQIKSDLSAFQTALGNLKFDSSFDLFSTASTDEKSFTAKASSSATVGSHSLEVSGLARSDIKLTNSAYFTATDTAMASAARLNDGSALALTGSTFTVSDSTGNTLSVSVDFAVDSLADLRDRINDNADNDFARASIVNDGTGNRLVLTALNSGEQYRLTTGGDTNLGIDYSDATKQQGQDATVILDGIVIKSASNTLDAALAGVSINLKGTTTSAQTLSVTRDSKAITDKLQAVVDSYNKLTATIADLHKKGGTLEADNAANSVIEQLRGVFNTPASISGGAFSYLAQVGVSFQKDGTLKLNTSDFESVLSSDFKSVRALFTDSTSGFASRLDDALDNLLNTDGLIDSRESGIDNRIKAIDTRAEQVEFRLTNTERRLRAQFTAMDSLVGTLRQTSSFLTSQFS